MGEINEDELLHVIKKSRTKGNDMLLLCDRDFPFQYAGSSLINRCISVDLDKVRWKDG